MTPLIEHSPTHQLCIQNTQASCSLSRQLCSHCYFIFFLSVVLHKETRTHGVNWAFTFFGTYSSQLQPWITDDLCCARISWGLNSIPPLLANRGMWIIDVEAMSEGKNKKGACSWVSLKVYDPTGDTENLAMKDAFGFGVWCKSILIVK